MEENLPNSDGIFLADLDPCHSSREIRVIEKLEINMSHWPEKSPDLNPIQNIQGIAEGRLVKIDCSTNEWLISKIIKVWFYAGEIRNVCGKPVMLMPLSVNIVTESSLVNY